jgi:glycerol-3-phosphate dehydrogenase
MTEPAQVDALILGGGINGCGTFRDLCAQGVDCLLLERDDFCSGASAGSSRLMHGGLKYLETGEFRLVRESAEERDRLLCNAAHYVRPLPSILPLRSRFGGIVPSIRRFLGAKASLTDRGSLITRAGLTLYDLYGRKVNALPGHKMLSRRALDTRVAGLEPGVIGAGLYYESQLSHAERLGLELILDGEAMHSASRALNHAEILGRQDGVVTYRQGGETHSVRPRVIINAGGAWIDKVNAALGLDTRLMGGSKGAHIVVENEALLAALNGHMVYFGSRDGRVNLLYPFMGKVLIGATDIKIDDPDAARCEAEEAAYLRRVVTEIFPDIPVEESQIRYRFSGVRPLPRADGEVGSVTRDHSIAELRLPGGPDVLCLIGGKWTTFRKFSEEAADAVLARIGRARHRSTETMAIGGGRDFPATKEARAVWLAERARRFDLPEQRVETLLARYGTRAEAMLEVLTKSDTPLSSLPDHGREELLHLARTERVGTLSDLLLRRSAIAMSGRLTPEVAAEIAGLLAEELGWDEGETRDALDRLPLSRAA